MAEPVPAGSDVSAGTYKCTTCGYELQVDSTDNLPPCPSCQDGRYHSVTGPTYARSHWAGRDVVVCVLENALLPAERAMVEMGEDQRIRESRAFLQAATATLFVDVVEKLLDRTVRAFSSAIDPAPGVVFEIFAFEPEDVAKTDGRG